MIGVTEIVLISAVILLIFGGKKVPELMKGMGKGVKSFKEGMAEPSEEEMKRLVDAEIQRRADAAAALDAQAEHSLEQPAQQPADQPNQTANG